MGCCFGEGEKDDENKPLLVPKDPKKEEKDAKSKTTKTSKLQFKTLEVQEFDKVFGDFARTMNPFVTDRENLETAVTKFKKSVESLQEIHPQASFREYVKTLKTTLKDEGIFIKIKNGAVEVYGVGSRSVTAVQNAVEAIKSIMSAAEGLEKMPEIVTTASGSAIEDAESSCENLEHIIRREFSGVFDICKIMRFRKNLGNNLKQLKSSPKMVKEFCEQVKLIVEEINKAFDEDRTQKEESDSDSKSEEKPDGAVGEDDNKNERSTEDGKDDNKKKKKSNADKKKKDKEDEKEDDKDSEKAKKKDDQKKKDDKKKDDKKKDDKKKKEDYQEQLKMETVGLPDIDSIFTDIMATLNRFVSCRERLQAARESYEKIMKTLIEFDGEKELKEYVKELKKKAKEGDMHIYIDTTDGDIRLEKVSGVDPPAPYRNAVKALNDVKSAARSIEDLEPEVQSGLESCGKDVAKIDPLKDFKKMVSGAKEVMKIPKKVKAFNENRKKVQKAPGIVKEFCLYVKQILVDIAKAFTEEDEKDKEDEKKEDVEEKQALTDESQNKKETESEKDKETESEKDKETESEKDKETESEKDKDTESENKQDNEDNNENKHEVKAEIHDPRKTDENEQELENVVV